MPKFLSIPFLSLMLFTASVVAFDNTERTFYINYIFILLLPCSIVRWFNNGIKYSYDFRPILLFVSWAALTLAWTPSFDASFVREQTCVLLIVQLLCYFSFTSDDCMIDYLLLSYIIGSLYFCISIFAEFGGLSLIEILVAKNRFGEDILNANAIGKNTAIASMISLYFFLKNRRLVYFLLIIFFVFFVLITRSRSSLLALVFGLLFILYFYFKGKGKIQVFLYVIGVVALVLMALSKLSFWGDTFSRLTMLFDFLSDKGQDDSTEQRFYYLERGFKMFCDSPLFGHGIGSSTYLLAGNGSYFHNNYIQLLVETGIVGFLFFYSFVFSLLKKMYYKKTDTLGSLLFSVLLVLLICDTNNTTYYHKLYYMFIGMSIMYIAPRRINRI